MDYMLLLCFSITLNCPNCSWRARHRKFEYNCEGKKLKKKCFSEAEVFCGENLLDKADGLEMQLVWFNSGSVAIFS